VYRRRIPYAKPAHGRSRKVITPMLVRLARNTVRLRTFKARNAMKPKMHPVIDKTKAAIGKKIR
jgi:hypothetical protein